GGIHGGDPAVPGVGAGGCGPPAAGFGAASEVRPWDGAGGLYAGPGLDESARDGDGAVDRGAAAGRDGGVVRGRRGGRRDGRGGRGDRRVRGSGGRGAGKFVSSADARTIGNVGWILAMRAEPIISCRGVVKRFEGRTVLDGIDLDIYPGETMVIMGGSGS